MTKGINIVISIFKVFLLLISFAFMFYVVLSIYDRLDKSLFEAIDIFLPYLVIFILFILNYVLKQKMVIDNMFYNLTSCLVFIVLIFISYRSMFDNYMLISYRNDSNINFQFFSDTISVVKSLLYLLIGSNILLMFSKDEKDNSK